MDTPTALIYVGNGSSLPGIPARDLSADEVALHGEDKLIASGLYKKLSSNKMSVGPKSNKSRESDEKE